MLALVIPEHGATASTLDTLRKATAPACRPHLERTSTLTPIHPLLNAPPPWALRLGYAGLVPFVLGAALVHVQYHLQGWLPLRLRLTLVASLSCMVGAYDM